jgi:hypothetical protein
MPAPDQPEQLVHFVGVDLDVVRNPVHRPERFIEAGGARAKADPFEDVLDLYVGLGALHVPKLLYEVAGQSKTGAGYLTCRVAPSEIGYLLCP